ncbi:DUF2971 domain-containing protein [Pseudomonas gingeri]|uniref:DUF2971 domain-containing protein n=1 Tax=Pseudomonas gingeri TaxID=117681 RepID=UPI0015A3F851|nr:DUF2971 domain-containing protein [Pseudomonas gingeri]NVZ66377.1 DUF2971 domain-containing protein [Pseudomonas gingeri]NVZ76882.1 DUF2971 domain-containing protein [Pseudomonas gingeri]
MTTPEGNESNKYFYRFRPIDNLLGGRQELEKQTIYFASQDQLNDPLEGHINVYWQGDAITWRNLFKHYLNCVIFTYNLWNKCNELGAILTWEHIPARDPLVAGIYPEHHELATIFFNNPSVELLINKITKSERRIGRNELAAHLRAVHYFVVATIHSIYRRRHDPLYAESSVESMQLAIVLDRIKGAAVLFDIAERKACGDAEAIEKFYIDIVKEYEEVDLLNYYTDAITLSDTNRVFIVNDFCLAYVRRLGTLIYPPWYAACFMEDCSAASMWAYYGESHAGVCLKFKAEHDANDRLLNLNTITGYNSGGKLYSMRPHQFESVIYQPRHASANFFETLGAIPHPIANSQWYTNRAGEISKLLLRTEPEREAWRKTYWERFGSINRTKTVSWEAEKEHRLIYYSMIADLSAEDRTLTYDFSSLEGIIFGVRTPTTKKIAIAKVIEKKCRESARSDFKFYQANFSNNQSEMTFSELRVLPNT